MAIDKMSSKAVKKQVPKAEYECRVTACVGSTAELHALAVMMTKISSGVARFEWAGMTEDEVLVNIQYNRSVDIPLMLEIAGIGFSS